jgi:carbonic anhydrase
MSFIKDYPTINDRINLIKKQPPINTSSPNKHILYCNSSGGRCDLNFNYKNYDEKNQGKFKVQNSNNLYSILINDGSYITYNGFSLNGIVSDKYYLNEIIFFTPSKNINLNKVYDLEANFIHISEDNKRCLIISLFLIVNDSDEFKNKKYYQMAKKLSFNKNFPSKKNTTINLKVKNWNFQDFLPDDKSFFNTILDNGIIGMLFLKNPIEIPQIFINKIINIIGLNNFITQKNNIIKNPPINPPYVQLFYSENLPINPFNNYECEKDCSIKPVPFSPVEEKSNIIVESFINFSKPLIEGFNEPEPEAEVDEETSEGSDTQSGSSPSSGSTASESESESKCPDKNDDDSKKKDNDKKNYQDIDYPTHNSRELTYGFGLFGTAFVFAFVLIYIFVIIFILYNAFIHTNIIKANLWVGNGLLIFGVILILISLYLIFENNRNKNMSDFYNKKIKKNDCLNKCCNEDNFFECTKNKCYINENQLNLKCNRFKNDECLFNCCSGGNFVECAKEKCKKNDNEISICGKSNDKKTCCSNEYNLDELKKEKDKYDKNEKENSTLISFLGIFGLIFTVIGIFILIIGMNGIDISILLQNKLIRLIISLFIGIILLTIGSILINFYTKLNKNDKNKQKHKIQLGFGITFIILGIIIICASIYFIIKGYLDGEFQFGSGSNNIDGRLDLGRAQKNSLFDLTDSSVLFDKNGNPIYGIAKFDSSGNLIGYSFPKNIKLFNSSGKQYYSKSQTTTSSFKNKLKSFFGFDNQKPTKTNNVVLQSGRSLTRNPSFTITSTSPTIIQSKRTNLSRNPALSSIDSNVSSNRIISKRTNLSRNPALSSIDSNVSSNGIISQRIVSSRNPTIGISKQNNTSQGIQSQRTNLSRKPALSSIDSNVSSNRIISQRIVARHNPTIGISKQNNTSQGIQSQRTNLSRNPALSSIDSNVSSNRIISQRIVAPRNPTIGNSNQNNTLQGMQSQRTNLSRNPALSSIDSNVSSNRIISNRTNLSRDPNIGNIKQNNTLKGMQSQRNIIKNPGIKEINQKPIKLNSTSRKVPEPSFI